MKNSIIGLFTGFIALTACNNNNADAKISSDSLAHENEGHVHAAEVEKKTATATSEFSVKEILDGYLQLKNALTKDDAQQAADAGTKLASVISRIDSTAVPVDKRNVYNEVQDDLKEHAEHIGANASKIDHQREHFVMMSKDIDDLVKAFGNGGQTLYKDFCPMANQGKGAIWISEVKDIKNPYLGKKMPDCGTVKETIQ